MASMKRRLRGSAGPRRGLLRRRLLLRFGGREHGHEERRGDERESESHVVDLCGTNKDASSGARSLQQGSFRGGQKLELPNDTN